MVWCQVIANLPSLVTRIFCTYLSLFEDANLLHGLEIDDSDCLILIFCSLAAVVEVPSLAAATALPFAVTVKGIVWTCETVYLGAALGVAAVLTNAFGM